MSRTLAIIQARLGSTRFPRKALADLHGKPIIQHVVDRVKDTKGIDRVIVAVPSAQDVEAFLFTGAECWRDERLNEDDVLGRFTACAKWANAATVIRITGDCPLWNPRIAEQVLTLYHSHAAIEYASNIAPGYTDGEDVEVFSASALKWANRVATDPYDREHVTPWLRRNVKTATLRPAEDRMVVKTSIDTPEDLERVREMVTTCT